MHTQNKDLLDALNSCVAACENCITSSLEEENVTMMAHCISLCRDSADFCTVTVRFHGRTSVHTQHILLECAEICKATGDECARHSHLEFCRICVETCRRCEAACRAEHRKIAAMPNS